MSDVPRKKTVYVDSDIHASLERLGLTDKRGLGDEVAWLVEQELKRRSVPAQPEPVASGLDVSA